MGAQVVLAGCGNMGFAMLKGWLASVIVNEDDVFVVEPADALRERAAGLGVHAVRDAADLPQSIEPKLVILAVKPQVMDAVLPAYRPLAEKGAAFASVAAGTTIATYEKALGSTTPIVRVMPNTPAAVGKGMMAVYPNAATPAGVLDFVVALMKASGEVVLLENEGQMDAVTAVSGSGPAYVFHMIEALRDAAIAEGLPEDAAALLAMQTIYGAAAYARESGVEPGTLRQQVTSPNGTTQAGLEVLMDTGEGLAPLMRRTVAAAAKRSRELAG